MQASGGNHTVASLLASTLSGCEARPSASNSSEESKGHSRKTCGVWLHNDMKDNTCSGA